MDNNTYVSRVEENLKLNEKLSFEIISFQKWLTRTFNIKKLSKKLLNYYELEIDDFLKIILINSNKLLLGSKFCI